MWSFASLAINLKCFDIILANRAIVAFSGSKNSASGIIEATVSNTIKSTVPDSIIIRITPKICSAMISCVIPNLSVSTPNTRAYLGSSACSASINRAFPPLRCTSAIAFNAIEVFPLASGP